MYCPQALFTEESLFNFPMKNAEDILDKNARANDIFG